MRKLIRDMDIPILIISIILLVFGLLNIVNASSQAVVIRFGTSLYNFFYKQAFYIFIGLVLSLFVVTKSLKKYSGYSVLAYFGCLFLLIWLLLKGEAYQGSINWLKIGPVGFQPSEFAKPAMILFVAVLFEKLAKKLRSNRLDEKTRWELIWIIIFSGGLYIGIVFLQKDLGTSIIMSFIFAVMFLTSPIRNQDKLKAIGAIGIILLAAVTFILSTKGSLLSPAQKNRLTDYQDPCSKYEEGGYQICNGYIAINDGGLFGVGIGSSKQISYIPESHTDSVFAIIAEELGLIPCTLIFLAYVVLLYRIFNLGGKTKSIKGKYICYGVGSYIGIHIIVNLGGLFGVMPFTGVPLPFLTYGGSFIIALLVSLAMVQRVHIEYRRQKVL